VKEAGLHAAVGGRPRVGSADGGAARPPCGALPTPVHFPKIWKGPQTPEHRAAVRWCFQAGPGLPPCPPLLATSEHPPNICKGPSLEARGALPLGVSVCAMLPPCLLKGHTLLGHSSRPQLESSAGVLSWPLHVASAWCAGVSGSMCLMPHGATLPLQLTAKVVVIHCPPKLDRGVRRELSRRTTCTLFCRLKWRHRDVCGAVPYGHSAATASGDQGLAATAGAV
jgi:hypothetical protein